jgi:hypothetical protein
MDSLHVSFKQGFGIPFLCFRKFTQSREGGEETCMGRVLFFFFFFFADGGMDVPGIENTLFIA